MEQVFVVNRGDFFAGVWPQGFHPIDGTGAGLLARFQGLGFFVSRAEAESQPAWKQIIPYCVIRRGEQVFCVQRKRAQTESRLHGLLSIGLGGHINPPEDAGEAGQDLFAGGLRRELEEELVIDWPGEAAVTLLGLLNDDSNAVGQVHVGLVYQLDLPARPEPGRTGGNVRVREISKMSGGFRSLVELRPLWQDPGRFESWSRVLLQAGIAGPNVPSQERSGHPRRVDHGREEPNHG